MKNEKNEKVEQLLEGARTVAVVCTQFGDTGKGKFVDLFADWADIIARGTGGANAGHTIRVGEKEYIFHLTPCGIVREGKINIIGNGVVLDPRVLCEELRILEEGGIEYAKRLFVAHNAKLVLPQHLVIDRVKEAVAGNGKIGTTGRGIGAAYEDHYARTGLTVNDLLNPALFALKLNKNLVHKDRFLRGCDPEIVRTVMHHDLLEKGRYWSERFIFNYDEIIQASYEWANRLKDLIINTDEYLQEAQGLKKILLEGAQGNLLSVDHGTYPYVTSSDCTIGGLAKGVGLQVSDVDKVFGIAKAFYMTRVGEGPFPTEFGGEQSDRWCASGATEGTESKQFGSATLDDVKDEFRFGIAVRRRGHEYGATTKRPRRTGWLDLPLLRYSKQLTGDDLILTKLDVLSGCPEIQVCTSYLYGGPDYVWGERVLSRGTELVTAIPIAEVLRYCEPVYTSFPGWKADITKITSWDDLPVELRNLIAFVEGKVDMIVRVVSVGPERDQTIFL